jgi:hypothetical protein
MVSSPFTHPLVPILAPPSMYAAQQQQQQQTASPSWHGSWNQQLLVNSFITMTPPALMEWVADSGASNHTTSDTMWESICRKNRMIVLRCGGTYM